MYNIQIQSFIDEYILGNIDLSKIPDFAVKLIESGYKSESLYILAGLDKKDWQDIKLYFEKTIKELGFKFKNKLEIIEKQILKSLEFKNFKSISEIWEGIYTEEKFKIIFNILKKYPNKGYYEKLAKEIDLGIINSFIRDDENILIEYGKKSKEFILFLKSLGIYSIYWNEKDSDFIEKLIKKMKNPSKKKEA